MEAAFILASQSDPPWTFVHLLSAWEGAYTQAISPTLQWFPVERRGLAVLLVCQALKTWLIMNLNRNLIEVKKKKTDPHTSIQNQYQYLRPHDSAKSDQ